MVKERFASASLAVDVEDDASRIVLTWSGRSMDHEPGQFILPILMRALEDAVADNKQVVLDFRAVEYLNSSTITPLIRVLEQARRGTARVRLVYNRSLRWQALSFTALEVFQTSDGRVEVAGI
ncbi:MAG: hypothetical protein IT384_04755 [Deltaproteobacteria bacterium]|nr:hypothetical protein [Deltaproteobacteria bacterium]